MLGNLGAKRNLYFLLPYPKNVTAPLYLTLKMLNRLNTCLNEKNLTVTVKSMQVLLQV